MRNNIQAVFLDRDGTIGGTGHFIHPNDFNPYSFSIESTKILKDKGIKVFGFTNQHRISKGQATVKEFEDEFKKYGIDKAYICPHPMNADCDCHKPNPGMLLQAAKEFNLDLKRCIIIGDVGTDMIAANKVGATKIIVKTGWGEASLTEYRHVWSNVEPDYVADNLLDAVNWIIGD